MLEPSISPLRRTTRLILSSEWTYQPQVYPEKDFLPSYVLIGLPAPESSNPLLLPLAGHELGHSLWRANNVGDELNLSVVQHVINAIVLQKDLFIKTYQSELSYPDIESATQPQFIEDSDRQYEILHERHRMVQVPGRRDLLRFRWAQTLRCLLPQGFLLSCIA